MPVDVPKARRGVMKFLEKKGGSAPIGELHTHSQLFFQAAHQDFSLLMEGLVNDAFVAFDEGTFSLTDRGRAEISS